MSKKDFSGALRKTAGTQKHVIEERFAKADSVLLSMTPEEPQAAPEAPVAQPLPKEKETAAKPEAVVRDTFSMPTGDHSLIDELRVKAAKAGRNTNKSEVVRAGLRALTAISEEQLVALLEGLERVKPGRK